MFLANLMTFIGELIMSQLDHIKLFILNLIHSPDFSYILHITANFYHLIFDILLLT